MSIFFFALLFGWKCLGALSSPASKTEASNLRQRFFIIGIGSNTCLCSARLDNNLNRLIIYGFARASVMF